MKYFRIYNYIVCVAVINITEYKCVIWNCFPKSGHIRIVINNKWPNRMCNKDVSCSYIGNIHTSVQCKDSLLVCVCICVVPLKVSAELELLSLTVGQDQYM